jgi:hypothetical protein
MLREILAASGKGQGILISNFSFYMLRFINKKEYWTAEDDGTVAKLPATPFAWHLKNIQDAVAFSWLKKYNNQDIAEIGGGDSRVLSVLSKNNRTTNIDSFEGLGNGPTEKPVESFYKIIPCPRLQFLKYQQPLEGRY